jgi:hypothetical protein
MAAWQTHNTEKQPPPEESVAAWCASKPVVVSQQLADAGVVALGIRRHDGNRGGHLKAHTEVYSVLAHQQTWLHRHSQSAWQLDPKPYQIIVAPWSTGLVISRRLCSMQELVLICHTQIQTCIQKIQTPPVCL